MLTPQINQQLLKALRRIGLRVSLESEFGVPEACIFVEYAPGLRQILLNQRRGFIRCPWGGGQYRPTITGVRAWLRDPAVRLRLHSFCLLTQRYLN